MSNGTRARRALAAWAAALVAAGGAAVVLWLTLWPGATAIGPTSAPPTATPTSNPQIIVLPPADVARLEVAIASDDPAVTADSLVPALRVSHLQQPARLLPEGATASIDPETMAAADTVGTVDVEVVGGPEAGRWHLLLQQIDGRWMIFGTERP